MPILRQQANVNRLGGKSTMKNILLLLCGVVINSIATSNAQTFDPTAPETAEIT
jgi:hypothetical protein